MFSKPIVVAIDLTNGSEVLLKFADRLASYFNLDIHVIHVYNLAAHTSATHPYEPVLTDHSHFQDKLEQIVSDANLKNKPSKIETHQGFAAPFLINRSKEASMLVSGTAQSTTFFDRLFGTVSTSLSKSAHCPVWLIPSNYNNSPITAMAFGSDWNTLTDDVIIKSQELLNTLSIKPKFVHIRGEAEDYDYDEMRQDIATKFNGARIDIVENESIVDGLFEYVHDYNLDGLIIVNRQDKSTLEKFLLSSTTHKIVFEKQCPLLVFHIWPKD